MTQRWLILFVTSIFYACEQKQQVHHEPMLVSDAKIYSVINTLIAADSTEFRCKHLVDKTLQLGSKGLTTFPSQEDSIAISQQADLFSPEDLVFIWQQVRERRTFRLDSVQVEGVVIIPSDTIMKWATQPYTSPTISSRIRMKYGPGRHCYMGLPLFSKDQTKIILMRASMGSGETAVYEKQQNKWLKIRSIRGWDA